MASVFVRAVLAAQLAEFRSPALLGEAGIYTNNETPDPDSVAADFDEPTWTGYSNLATPSWTAIANDGDDVVTTHPILPWINPGPGSEDIYGWFQLDGGGNLLLAELFSGGPVTVASGEGIILSGAGGGPILIRERNIP